VLSAAGNLRHEEVVRLAEQHLAGLPASNPKAWDAGTYLGGEWREARPVQEAQSCSASGSVFADRDFHAAHLLSAIAGGGMASRLFQEVRENRGLCYSIHSFYWPFADTGLFGIHGRTSEEDVAELVLRGRRRAEDPDRGG
jgi:predicted Zn-dependent peptidase